MHLLDRRFRRHVLRYLLQCGLAMVAILMVLQFPNILLHTAVLGALGASAFIVFTMPQTRSARPRVFIGGYVIGIAVGGLFCLLSQAPWLLPLFVRPEQTRIVLSALSVGLAIFLMVITNTEHPPAAGVALGLVLNPWDPLGLVPVLGGVLSMAILRHLLRSVLRNLF